MKPSNLLALIAFCALTGCSAASTKSADSPDRSARSSADQNRDRTHMGDDNHRTSDPGAGHMGMGDDHRGPIADPKR